MTGFPEWQNAEFDREVAANLVQMASLAAGSEAMKPAPVSRIRNPDGSEQHETQAEYDGRVVETAVLYLLEMGLLVMPDDVSERLENYFPVERVP